MSLKLPDSPNEVFMNRQGDKVSLTDERSAFSQADVMALFCFMMNDSDLEEGDIRLRFLEALKQAEIVEGWNKAKKRIKIPGFEFF